MAYIFFSLSKTQTFVRFEDTSIDTAPKRATETSLLPTLLKLKSLWLRPRDQNNTRKSYKYEILK